MLTFSCPLCGNPFHLHEPDSLNATCPGCFVRLTPDTEHDVLVLESATVPEGLRDYEKLMRG